MWVSVEVYDSYYSTTGFMCGEVEVDGEMLATGYDDKCGLAALIYDPDKDLLGKELRLWYIP